jgi:hypothetical protein
MNLQNGDGDAGTVEFSYHESGGFHGWDLEHRWWTVVRFRFLVFLALDGMDWGAFALWQTGRPVRRPEKKIILLHNDNILD